MRRIAYKVGVMLAAASSAVAAADPQPICADRPGKSTGECTVPVGRWQIETGLVDWTHDRSDGFTTDLTTIGSSLIKTGLGTRADLELGVTPFETVRTHGDGEERHSGFGDLVARVKYRLTTDDAPVAVALDPFVRIPTANHHLGSGKVEAGMVIATSAPIGKSGTVLSFDPELDWIADGDGRGHHVATQQVINLGAAVTDKLSVSGELWGNWDFDPAGTGRQLSADGSIAYLLNSDVQIDAGANFGINKQTPDVEVYAGVSVRF